LTHYSERKMSPVAVELNRIVRERPGIHFRELGRAAGLTSVGQLRHHLDRLERGGLVVEIGDGRFKRFFAAGEHEPRLRQGLARFSRRVPRLIAQLLLARPMNRTELRRSLGCADSTLGYHLIRMRSLGDLDRNRGRNCAVYSLTNPDFVRRMLQEAGPSAPVATVTHTPTLSEVERAAYLRRHSETPAAPEESPLITGTATEPATPTLSQAEHAATLLHAGPLDPLGPPAPGGPSTPGPAPRAAPSQELEDAGMTT